MISPSLTAHDEQPDSLCEMFLRDVAVLLVTTGLIKRSLFVIRTECEFFPELTKAIDTVVDLSDRGAQDLSEPLAEAKAILPALPESTASAVVAEFFSSIPVKVEPSVLANEVISSLTLLVQHIELKAMLAAESALLVRQDRLSRTLLKWAAEWRHCGHLMRSVMARVRARTEVKDSNSTPIAKCA